MLKLPLHQYSLLGEGSTFVVSSLRPVFDAGFSRVYKSSLSNVFVCKRLRRAEGPSASALMRQRLRAAVQEILALTNPALQLHENITTLVGLWWENSASGDSPLPVLLIEEAEFGTLADLQRRPLTLRYSAKYRLCLDIALGLEALHEASIVHGDLKNENVLIFQSAERGFLAKLGDFGSTTEGGHVVEMLGEMTIVLTEYETIDPLRIPVVTFPWNAPEYNSQVKNVQLRLMDIYSFGLLVLRTMLDGRNPFDYLGLSGGSSDSLKAIEAAKQGDDFMEKVKDRMLQAYCELQIARDLDVDCIFNLLDCTTQRDPEQRSLDQAIQCLGGQPSKHQFLHDGTRIIDMHTSLNMGDSGHHGRLLQPWSPYDPLMISPREDFSASAWAAKELYQEVMCYPSHDSMIVLLSQDLGHIFRRGSVDRFEVLRCLSRNHDPPLSLEDVPKEFWSGYVYWERRTADLAKIIYIQVNRALEKDFDHGWLVQSLLTDITMREAYSLFQTSLRHEIDSFGEGLRISGDHYGGIALDLRDELPFDMNELDQLRSWIRTRELNIVRSAVQSTSKERDKFWATTTRKYNLLHFAAMYGYVDALVALIEEFELDIDQRSWMQETPLHVAVRSGHYQIAHILIKHRASVKKRDLFLATPLHWLTRVNTLHAGPLLEELIGAGADINAVAGRNIEADDNSEGGNYDEESETWEDDFEDSGAAETSDTSSESGITSWDTIFQGASAVGTPLHQAVLDNSPEVVAALCRCGADPTIRCRVTSSPSIAQIDALQLAVFHHLHKLASIILPYYPQQQLASAGILTGLAISPSPTLQRMYVHGKNYKAAVEGTLDWCLNLMSRELFEDDISLAQLVSLSDAMSIKHILNLGLFQGSIEARMPFRGFNLTPLQVALALGKLDVFALLLEKGADISARLDEYSASNCLHLCACIGIDDPVILERVLCSASSTLREAWGDAFTSYQTPFMLALQQGNFALASALLSHEANIDATSPCQLTSALVTPMTILGHLARQGFETSRAQLRFLLANDKHTINPSFVVAPATGFTALHAAALCPLDRQSTTGTYLVLDYLLSIYRTEEEINQRDAFGCTALHLATMFGYQEAVQRLLGAGADATIRDNSGTGSTAVEYARANYAMAQQNPSSSDLEKGQWAVVDRLNRLRKIVDILEPITESQYPNPVDGNAKLEDPRPQASALAFGMYFTTTIGKVCDKSKRIGITVEDMLIRIQWLIGEHIQTSVLIDPSSNTSVCIPTWLLFLQNCISVSLSATATSTQTEDPIDKENTTTRQIQRIQRAPTIHQMIRARELRLSSRSCPAMKVGTVRHGRS